MENTNNNDQDFQQIDTTQNDQPFMNQEIDAEALDLIQEQYEQAQDEEDANAPRASDVSNLECAKDQAAYLAQKEKIKEAHIDEYFFATRDYWSKFYGDRLAKLEQSILDLETMLIERRDKETMQQMALYHRHMRGPLYKSPFITLLCSKSMVIDRTRDCISVRNLTKVANFMRKVAITPATLFCEAVRDWFILQLQTLFEDTGKYFSATEFAVKFATQFADDFYDMKEHNKSCLLRKSCEIPHNFLEQIQHMMSLDDLLPNGAVYATFEKPLDLKGWYMQAKKDQPDVKPVNQANGADSDDKDPFFEDWYHIDWADVQVWFVTQEKDMGTRLNEIDFVKGISKQSKSKASMTTRDSMKETGK